MSAPAPILRMHKEEPAQWEVAVDLDIPQELHREQPPAMWDVLTRIAERCERAILSDTALMSELKRLGIEFVGMRVEDC